MVNGSTIQSKVQTSLDFENTDISRFVTSDSGIHIMLSDRDSNESVMVRCEDEISTEVSRLTHPTSLYADLIPLQEDLYNINDDPDVGGEIFVIDYGISSTTDDKPKYSLSISPNPVASSTTMIQGLGENTYVASIGNLAGQLLTPQAINHNHPWLQVDDLPVGAYIITVTTEEGGWLGSQKLLRI